ncbi:MAG: helix-turn-helix domain-containing protein [bacterium]|nr:helix-turn-helix domain-containing protein [bacterium]
MKAQDLALVRRSKCISLDEISKQTKIRIGLLRAIEEGRFQALPGGVYTINSIQQYATALGLDGCEVHPSNLVELKNLQACDHSKSAREKVAPPSYNAELPDHIL